MKFRIALTLIALSIPAAAQSYCMKPILQNCNLSAVPSNCYAENQQKLEEYSICRADARAQEEARERQQREIDAARSRNSQSEGGPSHNCQLLPTLESNGQLVQVCR
jgi:hypothetical protein